MPTQKGKTPSKTPNKQSGPDRLDTQVSVYSFIYHNYIGSCVLVLYFEMNKQKKIPEKIIFKITLYMYKTILFVDLFRAAHHKTLTSVTLP